MDRPEVWENLAEIRRAEMAAARQVLGVDQVWLGFFDSGLPEGDPLPPLPEGCFAVQDVEVAAARLVAHIRRFRPHVLLTYDEKGGYPHPDHIMCHKVSMAAVSMAADPKAVPEAGPAWQVKKVYYHMGGHRNRFMRLDELMHEHGLEPVYTERLASFPDDQKAYRLTTFIPCADYFSVRDDALRAHATQIDPDGHWFAVPSEIQKMGWPTEDYQLVLSTVPTVIPEDDLFSGMAVPNPALAPDYSI
jgi:mycothiol S-conjugate amidase